MEKQLSLVQALRLNTNSRVAIVGSGGKTSALFQIARELTPPVLVTTSTHLGIEQIRYSDSHFFVLSPKDVELAAQGLPRNIILFTRENLDNGRTTAPDRATMERLFRLVEQRNLPILIEADGSRCLPLKAPAAHEPVIPSFVNYVIVMAGLSGLGKSLNECNVHRPELFSEISGLQVGDIITPKALAKVLSHEQGGLRNIPTGAQRAVILNQADTPELQSAAKGMIPELLKVYGRVLITSLKNKCVYAMFEPLAGIILAAGGSTRMKAPKLLLKWRGEPIIRHVARTAVEAGLDPVIIVTGAYPEEVENAVTGLPVRLVHNPDWKDGQSTSVRKGLQELHGHCGGAFFMLGDQPQIPVTLVNSLIELHHSHMSPITAPLVDGQRGNPVLWDRSTFSDLMKLEGDAGGRQLFSRLAIDYLPWHDSGVLLDVDTPEDYQRLIDATQ